MEPSTPRSVATTRVIDGAGRPWSVWLGASGSHGGSDAHGPPRPAGDGERAIPVPASAIFHEPTALLDNALARCLVAEEQAGRSLTCWPRRIPPSCILGARAGPGDRHVYWFAAVAGAGDLVVCVPKAVRQEMQGEWTASGPPTGPESVLAQTFTASMHSGSFAQLCGANGAPWPAAATSRKAARLGAGGPSAGGPSFDGADAADDVDGADAATPPRSALGRGESEQLRSSLDAQRLRDVVAVEKGSMGSLLSAIRERMNDPLATATAPPTSRSRETLDEMDAMLGAYRPISEYASYASTAVKRSARLTRPLLARRMVEAYQTRIQERRSDLAMLARDSSVFARLHASKHQELVEAKRLSGLATDSHRWAADAIGGDEDADRAAIALMENAMRSLDGAAQDELSSASLITATLKTTRRQLWEKHLVDFARDVGRARVTELLAALWASQEGGAPAASATSAADRATEAEDAR